MKLETEMELILNLSRDVRPLSSSNFSSRTCSYRAACLILGPAALILYSLIAVFFLPPHVILLHISIGLDARTCITKFFTGFQSF